MGQFLLTTSDILFQLLILFIIGRVILSWLPQYRYSRIGNFIFEITEPILRPFQRLIPPVGMMDLSPMVATIALWFIWQVVDVLIQIMFPV